MPAPHWEDLTEFLDEDEFATPVTVTRQDGEVLSFSGVYEDQYLNANTGEYEMDSERPRVWCRDADVPGVFRGDTCTIGGTQYDVMTRPQSDGTGMAMLDLAVRNDDPL